MRFFSNLWPFLLAVFSGVLLALVFPPFGFADLVWFVPLTLLLALWNGGRAHRSKRFGFGVGWVSGFVFWAVNLKWLGGVASGGYLLLAAYLAVFFGLFGAFASTVGNPLLRRKATGVAVDEAGRSLLFAAVNAFVWCGLEWVRGWLFTGFGWNGLGVAFHERLVLAQGAEVVGVAGLAFLPVFVGGVLVQVVHRFSLGVKDGKMERHWDFASAVLILMLVFFYGVFRISAVNRAPSDELKVLLVQQNIPQEAGRVLWSGEEIQSAFEDETLAALDRVELENELLVENAEGLVSLQRIDWVVWPEVVLNGPLYTKKSGDSGIHPDSTATIERMQNAGVRNFILGLGELETDENFALTDPVVQYNSLVTVNSDGEIGVHRKQHLVIYGEFIPFVDSIPLLGKIYQTVAGVPWSGNMGRGTGSEVLTLRGAGGQIRVIPSICFEDTVPRVARKFSKESREVIVNLTNDGWFGESEGSQQHFANALFRSIELRRPMMRAANRGVTGVVSATGSLVDYETGERQVLETEEGKPFLAGSVLASVRVAREGGPTIYARFGDWFSAVGLLLGAGWIVWRKRRAAQKAGR